MTESPAEQWRAVHEKLWSETGWAVVIETRHEFRMICGFTKEQAHLIANAPAKERLCEELVDALETLLPVAQEFERQASTRGIDGRREQSIRAPVFAKVRAVLTKAGRAPG